MSTTCKGCIYDMHCPMQINGIYDGCGKYKTHKEIFKPVEEICVWDNSDPMRYKTSCGETSGIEPEYHEGMKYCPYCGKTISIRGIR